MAEVQNAAAKDRATRSSGSSLALRLASKLGLSLVILGIATAAVLLITGVRQTGAFLPALVVCAAGAFTMTVRRSWTAKLSLLVWSGFAGLFLFESGFEFLRWSAARTERRQKSEYAASQGRAFDFRSQGEFLLALRSEGKAAYPAFPRGHVFAHGNTEPVIRGDDGKALVPLGSISKAITVYGNESGHYLIYQSDEHGFRNPARSWRLPKYTVAIVGDSSAYGASVPDGSTFADVIRTRYPATLNLGHGGNGPLSELGTIHEYLPSRRPALVLWAYYAGNDVVDLEQEALSPELRGYLEQPPRLQRLEQRQEEIGRKLRLFIDSRIRTVATVQPAFTAAGWLSLGDLRLAIWQLRNPPRPDQEMLIRTLRSAKDTVAAWGGHLVFVHLPNVPWRGSGVTERYRVMGMEASRLVGIPMWDLEERFAREPRRSEYFYPYGGHYTAAGYRRVGELLVEEIGKILAR